VGVAVVLGPASRSPRRRAVDGEHQIFFAARASLPISLSG
jgi:hypothetical protein